MSSTAPTSPRGSASFALGALRLVLGMVVGGGAMWLVGMRLQPLGWADAVAVALSLICLFAGLRLGLDSFDRRALARRLALEDPSTPEESRAARAQAGALFVTGLTLLAPLVARALDLAPRWPVFILVIGLVAIRVAYSAHVGRTADEFIQGRIDRACRLTVAVFTPLLLAYAAGERLGLLPPLTAWDVLAVFVSIGVVAPLFAFARNPKAA